MKQQASSAGASERPSSSGIWAAASETASRGRAAASDTGEVSSRPYSDISRAPGAAAGVSAAAPRQGPAALAPRQAPRLHGGGSRPQPPPTKAPSYQRYYSVPLRSATVAAAAAAASAVPAPVRSFQRDTFPARPPSPTLPRRPAPPAAVRPRPQPPSGDLPAAAAAGSVSRGGAPMAGASGRFVKDKVPMPTKPRCGPLSHWQRKISQRMAKTLPSLLRQSFF